jgi:hypothetical protein
MIGITVSKPSIEYAQGYNNYNSGKLYYTTDHDAQTEGYISYDRVVDTTLMTEEGYRS